jgi:hypothetical protein
MKFQLSQDTDEPYDILVDGAGVYDAEFPEDFNVNVLCQINRQDLLDLIVQAAALLPRLPEDEAAPVRLAVSVSSMQIAKVLAEGGWELILGSSALAAIERLSDRTHWIDCDDWYCDGDPLSEHAEPLPDGACLYCNIIHDAPVVRDRSAPLGYRKQAKVPPAPTV